MEKIEKNIDTSKLKVGDIVVISRHETYGYGEHYFSLGIVKNINKNKIMTDIITQGYGTKDIDNFIKYVELLPYVWETIDIKDSNVHRIPKTFLNDIVKREIEKINKEIDEKIKSKENLLLFYKDFC